MFYQWNIDWHSFGADSSFLNSEYYPYWYDVCLHKNLIESQWFNCTIPDDAFTTELSTYTSNHDDQHTNETTAGITSRSVDVDKEKNITAGSMKTTPGKSSALVVILRTASVGVA